MKIQTQDGPIHVYLLTPFPSLTRADRWVTRQAAARDGLPEARDPSVAAPAPMQRRGPILCGGKLSKSGEVVVATSAAGNAAIAPTSTAWPPALQAPPPTVDASTARGGSVRPPPIGDSMNSTQGRTGEPSSACSATDRQPPKELPFSLMPFANDTASLRPFGVLDVVAEQYSALLDYRTARALSCVDQQLQNALRSTLKRRFMEPDSEGILRPFVPIELRLALGKPDFLRREAAKAASTHSISKDSAVTAEQPGSSAQIEAQLRTAVQERDNLVTGIVTFAGSQPDRTKDAIAAALAGVEGFGPKLRQLDGMAADDLSDITKVREILDQGEGSLRGTYLMPRFLMSCVLPEVQKKRPHWTLENQVFAAACAIRHAGAATVQEYLEARLELPDVLQDLAESADRTRRELACLVIRNKCTAELNLPSSDASSLCAGWVKRLRSRAAERASEPARR
jgi:hypothetical protein